MELARSLRLDDTCAALRPEPERYRVGLDDSDVDDSEF